MSRKIIGAAIGAAMVVAGVLTGNIGLIAAGVGTIYTSLKAPGKPRVSPQALDRLTATMDANTGRKMWFGHTAGATDVRYQAPTGADQEYIHWIMVLASHEVEGGPELWFDTAMAWSEAGGVVGDNVGYLEVAFVNPGTSANGIAIDSTWTDECTLTGCPYLHIRFKRTGNDKKAESPFAQSIPTRATVRGKGALLPEIREPGVNADDQTTWIWLDDDSGRNPALQLLFYLIGWRIGGKLAVGRGMPVDRIDLDSFITAANLCDEPVTLAVGGTEPRYRSDGLFSETDDPGLVIGNLTAAMNAVLRDTGGKLAVYCLHNDLATPVASFSETDIIEDGEWMQTPPLDEFFNTVRGRYVDPSDEALYQLVDYPEVTIASVDDIERIDTFDLPVVQSAPQAQRLAKQRLQRNLYRGVYSVQVNERGWQVNLGDVVEFSHLTLGFVDKLFRVASHSIGLDGIVSMTLTEEHADIYAWDADESPAVVAAVPTAYDYLNNPMLPDASGGFIQATPPTAAESAPGAVWLDSDDGYRAYERVPGSGYLQLDGADVLLDGAPVELAWTLADDQRIAGLGDDGVLTIDEKTRILITAEASREAVWDILDAQAATLGVVTERTAAAAARTAWLAYRDSLTPAWDDLTAETLVDRATWNALDLAYDTANETLQEAITARAAPVYQISIIAPLVPTIQRDSAGAVLANQLPLLLPAPTVTRNGVSIRSDDGCDYAVANISATLGAVTVETTDGHANKGRANIPAGLTDAGSFDLIVTVDGIAQPPLNLIVNVHNAIPAQPPTANSKAEQTTIGNVVNSTGFAQVGSIMTVTKAAGETIRGFYGGTYTHHSTADSAVAQQMRFETSPTGAGTWTQMGAFVTGSDAEWTQVETVMSPGSITVNQTAAPADGTYDVRLVAAASAASKSLTNDGSTAYVTVGV